MKPHKIIKISILTLILLVLNSFSQDLQSPARRLKDPLIIQRIGGPITLDGMSDEPAWDKIRPLPVVMHIPNFGLPPSERTEILLGFDDNDFYVAGRLYDREPAKIQGPSKKRDYMQSNTDWFGVIFDTFNDKENGLGFFTTPSGLRWDGAIFNDAESVGELPINMSWNTFWDVRVVVNDRGWFAEMRIPFSSLRFEDRDGRVVLGLIARRIIARKNETIIFPAIDPKWGDLSRFKPSQAQEVLLEGVLGRNPLYIAPYVLGGLGQAHELSKDETAYVRSDKTAREAGIDVKYGLSSNLTADLTLNTDFAQVEADDYQVNLTRFSLFFPEKRLFFQERSGIFNFSFGEYNQLFYSRRIGIHEGNPVRIYGGTRLVGRIGAWDLGFLDMQTAPVEGLSSENFGVLRFRRRVFNPNSYMGGMMTSRLGADGSYNTAYGLDASLRVSGENYVLFNWAQTFENGRENNPVSLDPACLRIAWEKRTRRGLGINLGYSRAGKDYDPGIGFTVRDNFARFGNRVLYGWMPGEKSFLQSHSVFADGYVLLRNQDNSVESLEFGPGWTMATKSGWTGEFSVKTFRESLREAVFFSDADSAEVDVPPGDYTFNGITGRLQTPAGNLLSALLSFYAGSFYDGRRISIGVGPIWGISPDLSLSGLYQYNRAEFPDRKHTFEAQIAQLRLEATLSLKLSAITFVQYNSDLNAVIANVRFRFNPREGHDLYLVYNQDFNTHRLKKTPHRPYSGSRAFIVKYSYTFNL